MHKGALPQCLIESWAAQRDGFHLSAQNLLSTLVCALPPPGQGTAWQVKLWPIPEILLAVLLTTGTPEL